MVGEFVRCRRRRGCWFKAQVLEYGADSMRVMFEHGPVTLFKCHGGKTSPHGEWYYRTLSRPRLGATTARYLVAIARQEQSPLD